jgi:hypothetical protein
MFHRHKGSLDLSHRVDYVMAGILIQDEQERMGLLEQHLTFDFVFVSPNVAVDGPLGLSDAFAAYRHDDWRHISVRRTSIVDFHHAFFRYTWERIENGEVSMEGVCFGTLSKEGLISRLVSFDGLLLNPNAGGTERRHDGHR